MDAHHGDYRWPASSSPGPCRLDRCWASPSPSSPSRLSPNLSSAGLCPSSSSHQQPPTTGNNAAPATSILAHSLDSLAKKGRAVHLRRPAKPFSIATVHHSLVSIAASFARSAGERVSRAAASFTSGSAWSAVDDPRAVTSACPWCWTFGVPAFAFSGSLVQTLVQTGEGVGIMSCGVTSSDGVPSGLHRGSQGFESLIAHL